MTAKTRIRSAAAIATMAAVGALGLPSQALAGKSHHLKLYKVETHVDVEGDLEYTVSCKPGDIATDGMWRIDDVSQDNEFDILQQWALTVPIKATTVAGNTTDYVFRFLPIAGGDVQVKLIVVCLENPVDGHGHSHSFNTTRYEGNNTTDITANNGSVSHDIFPGGGTGLSGVNGAAGDCPASQYVPIAPGFDFTANGREGYAYVTKSWQKTTAGDAGWEWRFNVIADNAAATDNFDVTLSYRCLERRSNLGNGHRHRIIQQYKTKMDNPVPQRTFRTHAVHCGEHYKGMVGMWDVEHNDLYFLGMDPRIKSRAFKFVNVSNTTDYTVDLGLSCFKDRTS
jgi:hypothetical protein